MVLPEYIINEESDESSENASFNSEDDESDCSENSDEAQIPKGSLQGSRSLYLNYVLVYCFLIYFMFHIDMDGLDEALLEMAYGGDKDDEYFEKFKKSISSVPEQIIRYFIMLYLTNI